MTDLGTLESPQAAPPSTVLDAPKNNDPSGGGAPKLTPDTQADKFEPKSAADTLREVFKEGKEPDEAPADQAADGEEEVKEEKKPAKPAEKAEKDVKADKAEEGDEKEDGEDNGGQEEKPAKQRAKDGKFAPKEPKEDRGDPRDDAPKSFLPDAKEKWANVPNTVKRDINKLIADHEKASEQSRQATERYESIRDFDELARQNGRDLRDSLMRVHQIENELQRNPIAGLNKILLEAGPRKADGQPVSLYELAQFIVSKGQQGYQQMVAQQPQQQQQQVQSNPEVEQLKQQLAQMQQQQILQSVIEPFKADHPRYDELQDDIAFFLKSGKIPDGYSPAERLEAAYDMAVRINPTSHVEKEAEDDTEEGRVAESFAGSKSIKSAPGAVSSKMELERGGSIRDILEQERKRLRRS